VQASLVEQQNATAGKIPIRNLWLLMLYASNLYQYLGASKVDVEDSPDEITDLVAEVLAQQVEKRLQRNLSFGYQNRQAELSRVRGRIDLLTTERHRLLDKGKVACEFQELTINTARNQYVRAALESLSAVVMRKDLQSRCRGLAAKLNRLGVSQGKPHNYSPTSERLGRNDIPDQLMLHAAELAFNLALPTEFFGSKNLTLPDRDTVRLRKLFEAAVAGFYKVNLSVSAWCISSGTKFSWQISDKSAGVDAILPTMATDIIIDHKPTNERLVIDTKFNQVTVKGWYREESIRSGYLYQIYSYVLSQERSDEPRSKTVKAMLLHPSVGADVFEHVTIQNHPIYFCTIDLSLEPKQIKTKLLELVDRVFY